MAKPNEHFAGKLPHGDFQHAGGKRSWLLRLMPSVIFYTKVFFIIRKASRFARKDDFSDEDFRHASAAVLQVFTDCGVDIKVEGTECFRKLEGPCVFIGNHMSTAETFVLPCLILPFRNICFVVKRSLIEYPIFKHIMISQRPIVVSRENPRDDLRTVFEEGMATLKEGRSVIVFPQTTRRVDFDPSQFNSIGAKLASKAGVPVVPLALQTNAWSNGKWLKDMGRFHPEIPVRFAFGEPIDSSLPGKEVNDRVIKFIQQHLAEWQS
jgi:1-acyl-sn-glycerol-3-phosphate acyltransferase